MSEIVEAISALGTATEELKTAKESFENIRQDTEQRVSDKENQVNTFLSGARGEYPIYRLSTNQMGDITDGVLNDFALTVDFSINFTVHKEIVTGIAWADRDDEEREILTAMGLVNEVYFSPTIRVIKVSWSGWSQSLPQNLLFQRIHLSNVCTHACYAKLVSGQFSNKSYFTGITQEWGLCGENAMGYQPGRYSHPHPSVNSESGEVLFFWLGTVTGYVPIDRSNPKWSFYPHISASSAVDLSV